MVGLTNKGGRFRSFSGHNIKCLLHEQFNKKSKIIPSSFRIRSADKQTRKIQLNQHWLKGENPYKQITHLN